MSRDVFVADPLAKMPRNTFCQPARVHKNERRLVLANQLGQPVVNFFPHFAGHYCLQRRLRQFDCDVEFSRVTTIDDCAVGYVVGIEIMCPDQEPRDFFNRALCG